LRIFPILHPFPPRFPFSFAQIKLVNINSSDVVDGKPAIVLGLIWSIILYFQIDVPQRTLGKTVTATVTSKTASSTSETSSADASNAEADAKSQITAAGGRQALLTWVEDSVKPHLAKSGVKVRDFGTSWRDGRLLCMLINHIRPNSIDLGSLKGRTNRENLEHGFKVAEEKLGIPRLLDAEDLDVDKPDERSVMTYIAQFVRNSPAAAVKNGVEKLNTSFQFAHFDPHTFEFPARLIWKAKTKSTSEAAIKSKPDATTKMKPVTPKPKQDSGKAQSKTKVESAKTKLATAAPKDKSASGKQKTEPGQAKQDSVKSQLGGTKPPPTSKAGTVQSAKVVSSSSSKSAKPAKSQLSPTTQASIEPDPDIDPSLILSASTTSGLFEGRTRRVSYGGADSMDEEALRSLILATSPSTPGSADGGGSTLSLDKVHGIGSLSASLPSRMPGSNVTKAQAEQERIFLINIKELIARVRHNPISEQDFFTEFEILTQAQMEHESLTAYMMELSERKRQGLLLGLRPEELDRIEAEWSRVKPELDEWRWRLDEALPGDWKQIGLWLAQAERRLIADAELANQLGLEMAPGAANMTPTERYERLKKCLEQHEEALKEYERIKKQFDALKVKNEELNRQADEARDKPDVLAKLDVHLPESIVLAIENRLLNVELDAPLAKRRIERLTLRWNLAHQLDELRVNLTDWQSTRCKEPEEVKTKMKTIQDYLTSLGLPDRIEKSLNELTELSAQRDDIATGVAERRKEMEQKFAKSGDQQKIFLSLSQGVSVTTGGGAFMLMDSAETERNEANMFISSIRSRWIDAWDDVTDLQHHLEELQMKWETFEAEKAALKEWVANAKKILDDENSTAEERNKLYSELAQWRARISALNDLGHELMGQCDIQTASALDQELSGVNQVWTDVSSQVVRSAELNHAEQLKNQHADALHRLNEFFRTTERLLNQDFVLPETTNLDEANAATAAYRKQLEDARAALIEQARADYLEALRAAEQLMEAARAGQADMADAEALMAAARAAGERLDRLVNMEVPNRLDEVQAATQKAIDLALRLAPINSFIQNTEQSDEFGKFSAGELNLDLSGLSTEDAISKLKSHFTAIEQHEKALTEAEQRLKDLKAAGLKHVDVSQLELATAEARRKFEVLRAAAQRYEEALERRRIAERTFNASINELNDWLNEADRVMQMQTEAIEKHQQQAVSSEWLKDQLDEHKKFFEKLQEVGQASLQTVNRSYDELVSLYENDTLDFGVSAETAESNIVPPNDAANNVVVEASAKVQTLRDRYSDILSRAPQQEVELRYAMLEAQLRDQLELMNNALMEEESRIAAGEELSSILADHERIFGKSGLSSVCEQLLNEMRELSEQMSLLDTESPNRLSLRTDRLQKDFNQLTDHVGQLAVKLRSLPTQWADFDEKLYQLVDWTKEVEQLVRHLQTNPEDAKASDEVSAMELAARYRAMLSRFEELTGVTNEQGALAELLNAKLADLSLQGGLSATELATKRAALAAAIGSLRDLRSEVDAVLDRGEYACDGLM
uniref:Calponin-homology (CH) domain-containing protein n=1 Tax=Echinostoma caproni TaxID=27848 RepID=A0A183ACL4_9TREM